MITKAEARTVIRDYIPGAVIVAIAEYKTKFFVAQVYTNTPQEEVFDPFYIVDRQTRTMRDLPVLKDGLWREIFPLLEKAEQAEGVRNDS